MSFGISTFLFTLYVHSGGIRPAYKYSEKRFETFKERFLIVGIQILSIPNKATQT